jgi:APA family basic amino acid/polyamine antiporter
VLTVLKVVLVVGLVVVGFAMGGGDWSHILATTDSNHVFPGWRTIGLALMWVLFAYSGWNAAAYIGSEVRDPKRILPRGLLLGTAAVTLIYLAVNMLFVYAVPPDEMSGVISIAALAVSKLAGEGAAAATSLLVAFALFSSLSAYMILGPRVYYAMAVDGCFFRFAGRIHPKHGVPSQSVLLQGILAAIMVHLGTFDQILTYMGFSLGVFPLIAIFGVFKLRRLGDPPFRMPAYPIPPLVYLTAGTAILVLAFQERPIESSIAIGTVLLGLPAWFLFRARARSSSRQ